MRDTCDVQVYRVPHGNKVLAVDMRQEGGKRQREGLHRLKSTST